MDTAQNAVLDPHVKSFLAMLAAAGRPKVWQVTPEEARQAIIALAQAADTKDVPIGGVENGAFVAAGRSLPYRLYTPVSAPGGPLPAIVYFHGGGFVIGNLDTHEGMCRILANESGCRLISIDYRLAPEHTFPAAIEDGLAATEWVAANAAKLGIDADRLAVSGDSAGGNLAAVLCLLAKQSGRPKIALQVLFCPATDATHDTESCRAFAEGYLLEAESIPWFNRHTYPPGADFDDPRISPLRARDLSGLPPAHIHTAAFDPLRDEGKAYADRLRQAGVEVRYTCHEGMIHHFYALGGALPYAQPALKLAAGAIKQALG